MKNLLFLTLVLSICLLLTTSCGTEETPVPEVLESTEQISSDTDDSTSSNSDSSSSSSSDSSSNDNSSSTDSNNSDPSSSTSSDTSITDSTVSSSTDSNTTETASDVPTDISNSGSDTENDSSNDSDEDNDDNNSDSDNDDNDSDEDNDDNDSDSDNDDNDSNEDNDDNDSDSNNDDNDSNSDNTNLDSSSSSGVTVTSTTNMDGSTSDANAEQGGTRIWSGPTISFSKADNANPDSATNQDRLTDNVWITRGNEGGQIYNAALNTSAIKSSSPEGTAWAIGTLDQKDNLTFQSFRDAVNNKPKNNVGVDMVLHLIADDVYLSIRFTSWSSGQRGGFSYQRSTP